jgi:hypothetical protein
MRADFAARAGIAGLSAALAFVKCQREEGANIELKVYEGAVSFRTAQLH